MKKILAVAAFLLITALIPVSVMAGDLQFKDMQFFESGKGIPSDYSQRNYMAMFPQSGTRYINTQVNFINNLYGIRDHWHKVTVKYYNPDGSFRGESSCQGTVKSEWYTTDFPSGWGWENPGNWPVGTFRVEAYLDGVYIGQGSFKVYDNKPQLRFTELKFYESGYSVTPYEQRNYTTYFSQSTTRYVNVEVSFNNDLYMVRDQMPVMIADYWSPDGSFFGSAMLDNSVIKKEWDNPWMSTGLGWDTPGKWKRGTYRVIISLSGKQVAEGRFTIN